MEIFQGFLVFERVKMGDRPGTGFATAAASWRRRRDNPRFSSFSSSMDDVTFSSNSEPQGKTASLQLYGQIEKVFVDSAMKTQGTLGRWQEIQGAWILRPSKGDQLPVLWVVLHGSRIACFWNAL
ncbi:uncharacterized protein LOC112348342 isoform X1 [Selaginella moellendorffii]|uniref:uncharacterized protein LOC112348342 isoform X1 n=1 Tax=Selaginella moellendorffii TaxID=88036 RepID=UPI000D1CABF2|nr:uncharacterized protein LOC112348342 isoform X1 [Selaginella moellendorffii]|eukprot:XP_024536451.1 uncharacterized protein LOC112348342 isoform X1 [Selaginella moellendorffii]